MKKKRIWEIDYLRVIAIALMIVFHIVYDLNAFTDVEIDLTGFWYWVGRSAALTFMVVSGISSGFSKRPFNRGLVVLGYGMIITAVTYIFMRESFVFFGILHLLGVGMLVSPLLHKLNKWILLVLSLIIIYLKAFVESILLHTTLFVPLGIRNYGFSSIDYYPLVPYLGVFMLGVFIYKVYYYKGKSLFNFSLENEFVTWTSQQSLKIYLIHQPIILAIIFAYQCLP
ncbi:heparan-alpha-glucosaminide N-acetyltransferase [Proteinivorax hydrogeniformans]|uniref:Heparan-alpha-glucosaminide N-acetyltransferase n=1 Tax=Proteinivorax hydrogeniformans TaxID=1826727 RepID=A0AAU8HVK2_9FIRM